MVVQLIPRGYAFAETGFKVKIPRKWRLKINQKCVLFRNEGLLSDMRCLFCEVVGFSEFKNIWQRLWFQDCKKAL